MRLKARAPLTAPVALVVVALLSVIVACGADQAPSTLSPAASTSAERDLILISGIRSEGDGTRVGSLPAELGGGNYQCLSAVKLGTCLDWERLMAELPRGLYRNVILLSYSANGPFEPYTAADTCAPENAAANLDDYLKSSTSNGRDADIVTHSLGGAVVARAYDKYPALGGRIHSVVTLSSPINGSESFTTNAGSIWFCAGDGTDAAFRSYLDPDEMVAASSKLGTGADLWTVGNENDWIVTSDEASGPVTDNRKIIASGACPIVLSTPPLLGTGFINIAVDCPAHSLTQTLLADSAVLGWLKDHIQCDGPRWAAAHNVPSTCSGQAPTVAPAGGDFNVTSTAPTSGEVGVFPGEIIVGFTSDSAVESENSYSLSISPTLAYELKLLSEFPTDRVEYQVLGGLEKTTAYSVVLTNIKTGQATAWTFTTSNEQPECSCALFEEEQRVLQEEYYPLFDLQPRETQDYRAVYSDRLTLTVEVKNRDRDQVQQEIEDWMRSNGVDPATHTIVYEDVLARGTSAHVFVADPGCLNVREGPQLSARSIRCLPGGTVLDVVGGPTESDGYEWWQVSVDQGASPSLRGWAAADYLKPGPP